MSIGVVIAMAVLLIGGCTGIAVRENQLLPVIADNWQVLRVDALAAADPEALAAMDEAVATGNKLTMLAAWMEVRPWIDEGIERRMEAGQMSAYQAVSRQAMTKRMDDAVAVYVSRE